MKLTVGSRGKVEVRNVKHATAQGSQLNLLFLSDLHFTSRSTTIAIQIMNHAKALNPDLILLGGDYVDSKSGLSILEELMIALRELAPCVAVFGNHDYWIFKSRLSQIFESRNVELLDSDHTTCEMLGLKIDAKPMLEGGDVLLLHKPKKLDRVLKTYSLVFAGHLHGGQFVFWESQHGYFPGRLFYRWNRGEVRSDTSLAIISKGLGDTLPIRYKCPKELIYVELS